MLIDTATLGKVEVSEEDIYSLPEGFYGLNGGGNYALIRQEEEDITLMWLQAVDASVPCFVVFNPFEIIAGYEPVLEERDRKWLESGDSDELIYLVIAVVPEAVTDITVNLKSPVVLNKRTRIGRQVILSNRDYPISFPLFAPESEAEASQRQE